MKLLLLADIGNDRVGGHLLEAARANESEVDVVEPNYAQSSWIKNKLYWHFFDRRPPNMKRFAELVVARCAELRPDCVIAVGRIPLPQPAVLKLQELGAFTSIWLTDDPWNPAHHTKWFMQALPFYDCVFTPRASNLQQLGGLCRRVEYLPFAFSESRHSRAPVPEGETDCDVLFVGGADHDRYPFAEALIDAGVKVGLYGGYWENRSKTKPFAKGFASLEQLITCSQRAKIVLILVRRGNRDGHVMRSYEAAASGACLLVEDTAEHRQIFGDESADCVEFFRDIQSVVPHAEKLLDKLELRNRRRMLSYQRIVSRQNTYKYRLEAILQAHTNENTSS